MELPSFVYFLPLAKVYNSMIPWKVGLATKTEMFINKYT